MAFHQLVPAVTSNSTIVRAAIHLQLLARRLGRYGRIYASKIDPAYAPLIEPLAAFAPSADDLVLYHSASASPAGTAFLNSSARRGVVVHGSALSFYPGEQAKELRDLARAELEAAAAVADFAIILSENERKLAESAGFAAVHLVPRFVELDRLVPKTADVPRIAKIRTQRPNILAVGELLPHERLERLLSIQQQAVRLRPSARLALLLSGPFDSTYAKTFAESAGKVPGVRLVSLRHHEEVIAGLRSADVFISTSAAPQVDMLLEAMAADVPVMAPASEDFAKIAADALAISENPARRAQVLSRQAAVVQQSSPSVAEAALRGVLDCHAAMPTPTQKRPRRKAAKPRIAVVVQRYGDVIGGSERLTADVVRRLSPHWDITVLTTCAKNYMTWANEFPAGGDTDPQAPGVKVLRFPVVREREPAAFDRAWRRVFGRINDRLSEEVWGPAQGPYAPGVFEHLERHAADYDGFLFFTYLYALSLLGLPIVSDRALLVPTAHDEAPIALGIYKDVFTRPRGLLLLTPEELDIIDRYHPDHAPARAVGTGIDIPDRLDPADFRKTFGIDRPYLMYVGRIEISKGVGELVEFHAKLRRRDPDAPDLVLAGELLMALDGQHVHHIGRIDEQDKWNGLAGAVAVVVPSQFESLSLLAIEGMAAGTPILVNGGSEVLRGHVDRSRAGASYTDQQSFVDGLAAIVRGREGLSKCAKIYGESYTWPRVIEIYREEMDKIVRR